MCFFGRSLHLFSPLLWIWLGCSCRCALLSSLTFLSCLCIVRDCAMCLAVFFCCFCPAVAAAAASDGCVLAILLKAPHTAVVGIKPSPFLVGSPLYAVGPSLLSPFAWMRSGCCIVVLDNVACLLYCLLLKAGLSAGVEPSGCCVVLLGDALFAELR